MQWEFVLKISKLMQTVVLVSTVQASMKATVSLFLLLVIFALVAGRKLPQNDPETGTYENDYPVDDEDYNQDAGSALFAEEQYFDIPIAEENDPVSAYWMQVNYTSKLPRISFCKQNHHSETTLSKADWQNYHKYNEY